MKNGLLLLFAFCAAYVSYGQDTSYVRFTLDNNQNIMKVLFEESGMTKFREQNDFYDNNVNITIGLSKQIVGNTFANVNVSTNESYAKIEFVELINGYTPRGRHILHQYAMDLSIRQYFLTKDILFVGVGGGYNIGHSSTDLSKNSTFNLDPVTMEDEPYEPQFVANHPYFYLDFGAQWHYKSIGIFIAGQYKNSALVKSNVGGVPNYGFSQWGTRFGLSFVL